MLKEREQHSSDYVRSQTAGHFVNENTSSLDKKTVDARVVCKHTSVFEKFQERLSCFQAATETTQYEADESYVM
jgi:hypothetical protein